MKCFLIKFKITFFMLPLPLSLSLSLAFTLHIFSFNNVCRTLCWKIAFCENWFFFSHKIALNWNIEHHFDMICDCCTKKRKSHNQYDLKWHKFEIDEWRLSHVLYSVVDCIHAACFQECFDEEKKRRAKNSMIELILDIFISIWCDAMERKFCYFSHEKSHNNISSIIWSSYFEKKVFFLFFWKEKFPFFRYWNSWRIMLIDNNMDCI